MRIIARIDQLRVNANLARGALHAALQHMCHPELLRYLAQIARGFVSKLHHARAADHFQIRHLRQVGENLVLHAVREEGVLDLSSLKFSNGNTAIRFVGNKARVAFRRWPHRPTLPSLRRSPRVHPNSCVADYSTTSRSLLARASQTR